jgi:hypothetical protein
MPTANIINNSKLLDELIRFDSYAGLFTNNISENEENPEFTDPLFTGYSPAPLFKENWGPSVSVVNYATIEYSDPVVWNNNNDPSAAETINGYYIRDSLSNHLLWFKVFETPLSVNTGESVAVYPKITLNKYEPLLTTFTFNMMNSNPNSYTAIDPVFEITEELWGTKTAAGSLFDISLSDFGAINGVVSAGLDQRIHPTTELPFSFKITITQPGFLIFSKDVSITEPGDYLINIKLIEYTG